jgi:hypothetical protein
MIPRHVHVPADMAQIDDALSRAPVRPAAPRQWRTWQLLAAGALGMLAGWWL